MMPSLSFLNKLTSSTLKFRSAIVSAFISFFAPLYLVLCATYFFIIFDWIYGYRVSRKYGHKKIQSSKLKDTGTKLTETTLLISSAHIFDTYIIPTIDLHAVEVVAGMVCLVEFWSILESFCDLYPKWKLWKILSRVIQSKGEKYLEVELDDILTTKKDDERNTKHNQLDEE